MIERKTEFRGRETCEIIVFAMIMEIKDKIQFYHCANCAWCNFFIILKSNFSHEENIYCVGKKSPSAQRAVQRCFFSRTATNFSAILWPAFNPISVRGFPGTWHTFSLWWRHGKKRWRQKDIEICPLNHNYTRFSSIWGL